MERDSFCSQILALRIRDGLLHRSILGDDVTTFKASQVHASGCGGGFPCQAGQLQFLLHCILQHLIVFRQRDSFLIRFASQGISQAGSQLGMADRRSCLLKHCFRIFDTLTDPQLSCMFEVGTTRWHLSCRLEG